TDRLSSVSRGQGDPGVRVDVGADETHTPITEQDVAARPRMFGPHLIGMSERVVGSMDNDLRMVMHVRSAVDADQAASTVAVGWPGAEVEAGTGSRTRHHAHPRLVAQDR